MYEQRTWEVQSYDDTADYMGHEGEYRAKYPCSKQSWAPCSGLLRDILEIEDIFYKTESERYEDGEEYSFFHGVDKRKGARKYAEVFAGLLYDRDYHIVEKYEFQRIEYNSPDSDSPICKYSIKDVEPKKHEVENREQEPEREHDESVSHKGFPDFWDVCWEYPHGECKNSKNYESYRDKEGVQEFSWIIPLDE